MLRNIWKSWFSFGARKRQVPARTSAYRPRVDTLEDRLVPSANSIISGFAFIDATGNGYAAGDAGQSNVAIHLYRDSNHNGQLDSGDALVASQSTAANGAFSFKSLAAGSYFVSESAPSGFVQTTPTIPSYFSVSLAANQTVADQDFANFQKPNTGVITNVSFTITDAKLGTYTVTNLRGNTHQGDTVVANFTVSGSSSVLVSLETYDAPGANFDANTASQQVIVMQDSEVLSPGRHSLTVNLPQNFYQVDFILGAPITTLGPAGSNLFYSAQDRLISADNEGCQAFVPATLSGIVYNDVNSTGIYTSTNDVGLPGVTVTLTGTNDLGQTVSITAVTADGTNGPLGSYTYANLRPGTYTITQVTPPAAGFTDETSKETFTLGGTATPGAIAGIIVPNGGVEGNYNLPEVAQATAMPAAISGVVYVDPTKTGAAYAQGDALLSGVTVTLWELESGTYVPVATAVTTSTGMYSFTGLAVGTYELTWTPAPSTTNRSGTMTTTYTAEAPASLPAGETAGPAATTPASPAGTEAIVGIAVSSSTVINLPETSMTTVTG